MSGGPADAPPAGALTQLLCLLTRCIVQRPYMTLLLGALSVVGCLFVASNELTFKTDRSDLIDPQTAFQKRWLAFTEKFGNQSDIVLVVQSNDPARVRMTLDEIGERLVQETDLFRNVTWKFDPAPLRRKGLQYLPPRQLEHGLARLETYGPILAGHWSRAGLESYCRRLSVYARWAHDTSQTAEEEQAIQQAAQLSDSLLAFSSSFGIRSEASLLPSGRPEFRSPWPEIFPNTSLQTLLQTRYQVTEDGRIGFLSVMAVEENQDFAGTSPAISRLRLLMAELRETHPDVELGLTGIPVLESDEMSRSQQDMSRASLISFGAVAFILLIGFRGLRHPLLGLIMLLVGLTWAIGYTTLTIGHLNILSISFAAILIGLGVDFAVHFLWHYLELRRDGVELDDALVGSSGTVGTGIVTGAVTTAIAFGCAALTSFLGIAELGIIAGGGVLLCAAAAFLVLVPLLRISDRNITPSQLPTPFEGRMLGEIIGRWPKSVALLGLSVVVGTIALAFDWSAPVPQWRIAYNSNLLDMQADDIESVAVQQRLFNASEGSLLYAVSVAPDANSARQRAAQFEALDSVVRVEHLCQMMPYYPRSETALLVQGINARLAHLAPLPRDFPAIDPLAVGQALEELLAILQDSRLPSARGAAARLNNYLDLFEQASLEEQMQVLGGYQSSMLMALRSQLEQIAFISNPQPVTPDDLPAGLRERSVSPDGEWVLRIFPRQQIWDEAPLAEFVQQLRTIDPEVTGTPLQNYEAALEIRDSYQLAAVYALVAVIAVLMLDFLATGPLCVAALAPLIVVAFGAVTVLGPDQSLDYRSLIGLYMVLAILIATIFDPANIRNLLLALTPPVVGMGMMFGILGWMERSLNPANIIVLPLLLGVGVDYGVFVIHDFRRQKNGYRMGASTLTGLILTSLTSMAGFGSLMVASHRGLASLGLVLVIGVGCSLFVAMIVLPAILTVIAGRPSRVEATEPLEAFVDANPAVPVASPSPGTAKPAGAPSPETWQNSSPAPVLPPLPANVHFAEVVSASTVTLHTVDDEESPSRGRNLRAAS